MIRELKTIGERGLCTKGRIDGTGRGHDAVDIPKVTFEFRVGCICPLMFLHFFSPVSSDPSSKDEVREFLEEERRREADESLPQCKSIDPTCIRKCLCTPWSKRNSPLIF